MANNLHQVIAGLKVVDVGAIEPMTDKFTNLQSRTANWPTRTALGRKTELMCTNCINHVHSCWGDCDVINSENEGKNLHFLELKPFNLYYTNDMSAGWKLTKKGGCSKTKKSFVIAAIKIVMICMFLMRFSAKISMKYLICVLIN